jgi:hypothetical protein
MRQIFLHLILMLLLDEESIEEFLGTSTNEQLLSFIDSFQTNSFRARPPESKGNINHNNGISIIHF